MRALTALFLGLAAMHAIATVDVVVEAKVFQVPGADTRVEVNMAILAGTAMVKANAEGYMRSRVEAITIIEQDGAIKAFAKTEVLGPERLDSMQQDLVHQESFTLPAGSYDLFIEIRDLNKGDTAATRYHAPLAVGVQPAGVSISDIVFAERFDKANAEHPTATGYTVVPLLSDYLPRTLNKLAFYAEIYGTENYFGKDSLFLLSYHIENLEHHKVVGSFKHGTRAKAAPVVPVMAEFGIEQLTSGNYLAVVEAIDKKGEVHARRELFFQRNNPISFNYDLQAMATLDLSNTFVGEITDADSLAEHIASMRPIADPLERKIIDDRWKDKDMDLMRRFFYSFWSNRSSADPAAAWRAYRAEVVKVNKLFGCRVQKGYQTDRGQAYLKYGPPNTIMDRMNEMDSYPYSIWHYYRAGRFTNRRFIFYQPDLISQCMQLLHSEVPGEIQNPRWNQILHSRNVASPNVDPAKVDTQSGEKASDFFLMPR